MTDPITLWHEDGAAHGWVMPRVPGWWRWWGVRHVRWAWARLPIAMRERKMASYAGTDKSRWYHIYDRWVLFGIWHGLELKRDEHGGGG